MAYREEFLSTGMKQVMAINGLLLAGLGLVFSVGMLAVILFLAVGNEPQTIGLSLIGAIIFAVTVGTGGALFWHSVQSLAGRRSKPLDLPPVRIAAGAFILFVLVASAVSRSELWLGLLLYPGVVAASTLLPLVAVAWFSRRQVDRVTWRQGLVAFLGSATISLVVIISLELLSLVLFSLLTPQPVESLLGGLEWFEDIVSGAAFKSRARVDVMLVLLQAAILVPIFGTFAKSLVTLPLLSRFSRREAFLIGSIAGAGYGALELSLFLSAGPRSGSVLLLVATGAAIHPLGGGLMAVGWQRVLKRRPYAGLGWLALFGAALSLHSLWNFGFLGFLVVTETLPTGITLGALAGYYLAAAVVCLVLLVGLGLIASWSGRSIMSYLEASNDGEISKQDFLRFTALDRRLAVWALAGLAVIVPTGIVVLRFLN